MVPFASTGTLVATFPKCSGYFLQRLPPYRILRSGGGVGLAECEPCIVCLDQLRLQLGDALFSLTRFNAVCSSFACPAARVTVSHHRHLLLQLGDARDLLLDQVENGVSIRWRYLAVCVADQFS
jgi:hypothetical protein